MSLTRGSGPLGGTPAAANYTIRSPAHKILFERDARRLRAYVGDTVVLDTRRAHLLHETGIRPVAYVPLEDLDQTLLERTATTSHCPFKGDASYWSLRVGDDCARTPSGATRSRWSRRCGCAATRRCTRPSTAGSSRTSRSPAGCATPTTASTCTRARGRSASPPPASSSPRSEHPTLVFETSMPVRAYLPRGDVMAGHLRPSDRTSTDPYMGDAIYWHVHAGGELLRDAAHSYELPRAEAMKIAGLVCFSGEGVDVELDA